MQPLSYQVGKATCWCTSIINGIMHLNKDRIESFQYKTLHSALNSILCANGLQFDKFEHKKIVTNIIGECFSFRLYDVEGVGISDAVRNLDFQSQVAVCSVDNEDHCILLNGKSECGEWLSAFDPWWHENDRSDNTNVRFPKKNETNVEIRMHHLLTHSLARYQKLYERGEAYPMGNSTIKHDLTVFEMQT